MLHTILLALHIIISVLLVISVLMQPGRGEGLSEAFGVTSTQKFFGAQTNVVLAKITAVLAGLFLISCLTIGVVQKNAADSLMQRRRPVPVIPETRPVSPEIPETTQPPPQGEP